MVAPHISALNGREVAGTLGTRCSADGAADGQVEWGKFGVFVPPGVVDPLTGFQQGVVVPEETRLPQPVGQSSPGKQRTPRHFHLFQWVHFFVGFLLVFFFFYIAPLPVALLELVD